MNEIGGSKTKVGNVLADHYLNFRTKKIQIPDWHVQPHLCFRFYARCQVASSCCRHSETQWRYQAPDRIVWRYIRCQITHTVVGIPGQQTETTGTLMIQDVVVSRTAVGSVLSRSGPRIKLDFFGAPFSHSCSLKKESSNDLCQYLSQAAKSTCCIRLYLYDVNTDQIPARGVKSCQIAYIRMLKMLSSSSVRASSTMVRSLKNAVLVPYSICRAYVAMYLYANHLLVVFSWIRVRR